MHVSYLGFIFMWELHMMLLRKSLKPVDVFHQIPRVCVCIRLDVNELFEYWKTRGIQ
jgi:hypothetical protein